MSGSATLTFVTLALLVIAALADAWIDRYR